MDFLRVAAVIATFAITWGARMQHENIAGASIAENSEGELDVNEYANFNTKAFVDANVTSGVCKGKASPPSCCCVPVGTREECLGQDFAFHPKVMPYDNDASKTRTCYPLNLCCHQSAKGKCGATIMLVKVVSGDNHEKKKKAYVKIQEGNGNVVKTGNAGGKKGSQWNDEFRFSSIGKIKVEVKYKKPLGNAGTYGTFEVSPKLPLTHTQTVKVPVPKFGMVTLQITPQVDDDYDQVDDDYDPGLCSLGDSASFLQRANDPIDDFLASLDEVNPQPKAPIKDEPIFLNVLNHRPNQLHLTNKFMTRDYTLIIDRSGSMGTRETIHVPDKMAELMGIHASQPSMSRWQQVDGALQYLAPYIVEEDPDGVGVYFFDSNYDKAENICDKHQVVDLFKRNRPGGRTYLADALEDAMEPDTVGRAETIFVLTDGAASDPQDVARAIVAYTNKMCKAEMLSISFIQVGSDAAASQYLNRLDDDLENEGAKFDIVDAMTKDEMEGKSFLDVIELSVYD